MARFCPEALADLSEPRDEPASEGFADAVQGVATAAAPMLKATAKALNRPIFLLLQT